MSGVTYAVEALGLTKTFGKGALAVPALRGVDFRVQKGEFVMLAGPSGSGKTTLLSLLGCVLKPTTGSIRIFDETVSDVDEGDLPRVRTEYIGFVFQGHNLIASLTAAQNVVLPLELRGMENEEAWIAAEEILARVGLGDKADRKPMELSGGQRQRVAIARAVAGGPPLILADEPTAALDAENGRLVTEMLRGLAKERGHTVVVVTHDSRIFHLADRIVHIEDGLIQEGHP
jgi:putative ABC transport system ATP-binding protein